MTPVYITDIIGEVVAAAKIAIVKRNPDKTLLEFIQANEKEALGNETDSLIQTIDYQHGHKKELIETLFQMDKSEEERELKYPLVYLVQDFAEERGKNASTYAEVSLNVIIAHHTNNQYKISDREEKVFKPVLYPIYDEFLNQLAKHSQIHDAHPTMIPHRKTDRSYWGRISVGGNDQNKLNDYLDAIEIENLKLKILFKNC